MYILGISAYYHDSAAVLLKDGRIVCGIEEERFSRIKHDNNFPYQAITFCLQKAKLTINDIEVISYYEKPLLKFERILESFIATYPHGLKPFLKGLPEWLGFKIKIEQTIRKKLNYKEKVCFTPHHISHASSAFYPSPYKDAAILTIDGVGEYQTTGLWKGEATKIVPLQKIDFPHSIGLLYSTFTGYLGFKVNEDEYKLMGLAAYGQPSYVDKIKKLIDIKADGSFQLDMQFFSFRESFRMWSDTFEKIFGKPRNPRDEIQKKHKDLASSIQSVTEEIYFKILSHLYSLTGYANLCISGGVALNALANGKIHRNTPFKNVYIFGAASDSGTALGSALYAYFNRQTKQIDRVVRYPINSLSLGSSYSNRAIEKILKQYKLHFVKLPENKLIHQTAKLLADGNILGWFYRKAEFGPRALGNRSILCKPSPKSMKTKMNIIKRREQFRPFAGSILQEKVHDYFKVPEKNHWSPYMVFCFPVKKNKRKELAAIVHKDRTCRIQTVSKENGRYYKLIKEFDKQTGTACILNTSFNLQGEPIVQTPQEALQDFLKTKIDYLVIEDFLIVKNYRSLLALCE
ncbi:MAG: carbamoyltransferase N-terminal domain-containing protein [Patescibacteria group bacterium]